MTRTPPKLRVMVDANVLIAGIVWPRWSREVLRHAVDEDFQLVLSNFIIKQARKRISKKFPDFLSQFEQFLRITGYELVDDPTKEEVDRHKNLVRDTTDVPIALAAINAKVDYLVSEDKDLTVKDDTTQELRKQLNVLIAGTFLREVMGWQSEELDRVKKQTWRDLSESENG